MTKIVVATWFLFTVCITGNIRGDPGKSLLLLLLYRLFFVCVLCVFSFKCIHTFLAKNEAIP